MGSARHDLNARTIDFYTLFWIFIIGSFGGYILETVWRFFMSGGFEYRSSMILSPFIFVYGLGALTMYVGLRRIDRKKIWLVFIAGAVVNTIVEFFASLLQEMLIGSVSWDYSGAFLNIDGRVCLQFSIGWGLLSIAWVKWIQPLFEKLIAKIPVRVKKPLTLVLVILLIVNAAVTIAAVSRWGMRLEGATATNSITVLLDNAFPNDLMREFYPTMYWLD